MDKCTHKKGFTLIEIMFFMSLCAIVFTLSFTKVSLYNEMKNNIFSDETGVSLVNFIKDSRQICREENKQGYIYFNVKQNKVDFNVGHVKREEFCFPKGVVMESINAPKGKIIIDNRGFTSDACTLKFKDNGGKTHRVTICVGTAHVEFKG
ncbi:prepilin-type N-terminal cleavage/methylation domain-containing protein [Clostridium botulinum]|nr:prepilin-type N-terminal cleavage/methylation domain-containing protein [Clostridium botulinum]